MLYAAPKCQNMGIITIAKRCDGTEREGATKFNNASAVANRSTAAEEG